MTAAPRPPRQDLDATRARLLEAGRQLLIAEGTREYVDVPLRAACEAAGYTTGAAYPIFGNQRGFQEQLALYVASTFDWAGPESIGDDLVQVVATTDDHLEALRQTATIYFERFVANDDFYLALRFWSVRDPSPELRAALEEGYRVVHDGFAEVFAAMMAHYGIRLRSPVTIDQLTVLVTALTEGLALRHRIDPQIVDAPMAPTTGIPSTLFAEGMVAFVRELTEPIPTE